MIVRETKKEDLARVADLHARSIRLLCQDHYTPAQIRAWTDVLNPVVYESALTAKYCIVACDGNTILGMGMLSLEDGEIHAVYVDPDQSGRGVGSLILSHLEETARQHDVMELTVFATLNARGFYEGKGYNAIRPALHSLPNGLQLECIEMRKRLDSAGTDAEFCRRITVPGA
ncbi:MAG: GNAT family N-acetyltransferase [Desulfovibrionaceae bacterium]|nr:GNAT family N-acetyltransferase [Desulfovibrionaceae bacterium]